MEFNNEHKNIIGLIFLVFSIVILGYMLITPSNHIFTHIDEEFTFSVLNFPIWDILTITANDVHPPLHYLLLKLVSDFLTILGLSFDKIFVYKFMSIASYIIILILSITKIKNEYGYLTAGLFSFSMGVMSEFFIHFLIIRMYSLAVLFVVLAFVYLKDVLDADGFKPWLIFTIFAVLGAYTHYFTVFPLTIMYLLLFLYLILTHKDKIKFWIGSVLLAVILYVPWISTVIYQVTSVHNADGIHALTLKKFLLFLGYYSYTGEVFFSVIAVIIAVVVICIYKKQSYINNTENFYVLCGVVVYFGTILITSLISVVFKPILLERYLLPVAAVLWFVISIMISRINNKKEFLISFLLILILLLAGTGHMFSSNDEMYHYGANKQTIFDQIFQDNNSIFIVGTSSRGMNYLHYANSTNLYLVDHVFNQPNVRLGENLSQLQAVYDFSIIPKKELPEFIHNNSDKNIYFVYNKEYDFGDKITNNTVYREGRIFVIKVS